jgi:hypothetical protein
MSITGITNSNSKEHEETIVKKLYAKYKDYVALSFLYGYLKANNYVLNFVDTCKKIDGVIQEFKEETKGYITCVKEAKLDSKIMFYIRYGCYPESTKRVQVLQTRISQKARYVWYVNLELFENEKRLPMITDEDKNRIYDKDRERKIGNNKEEIIKRKLSGCFYILKNTVPR